MADKEATVYVVDVGKSMGTENELSDDPSFANISVIKPLGQVLMCDVRSLQVEIKPSRTDEGDAISALVVAIQMIITFCKKLKYNRKIILVTNGIAEMDPDGLGDIVSKIKEDRIELTILGADFDDPQYGYKEEDKDPEKASNEEILRSLVNDCDGILGTLEEAVTELGIPRIKTTRPVPSFKGFLTLGDPKTYDSAMVIDVERFPRIMVARAPPASNFVVRSDTSQSTSAMANMDVSIGDDLAGVKNVKTYQVKDEEVAGGKRDVARDDLSKGYEYGRTVVHISESDSNVTKLETMASLEIIGFVPNSNIHHYMSLERSNVIVAQRTNPKAIMALSSFIHGLYELETCAVARVVIKDGKDPLLVLLSPSIDTNYECLVEIELPFAEDIRAYKFPPLDRIVTVSGKVLKEHRNLPSNKLQAAMDDFVDNMDLSTFDKDEKGQPAEYAKFEDTYSPVLHILNRAIRHRATHPSAPAPPPHSIITKYTHPPEGLLKRAQPYLESLRQTADVKKVPPKSFSKKRYRGHRQEEKPRSGLDITGLLSTRSTNNQHKISRENAIPDFRQMLDTADDVATIGRAVTELGAIIEDWIQFSLGNSAYERAMEALGVMKRECVEMEEPGEYNEYLKELKRKLGAEELGGDRREMWRKIVGTKLGLITKHMSHVSNVTDEEAKNFLYVK